MTMLEDALTYAARGWAIFPLQPGTKDPFSKNDLSVGGSGEEGGFKVATTDPTIIRGWWGHWPRANIGLACGASGIVVIDIDVKNGARGKESWALLLENIGQEWAMTLADTTPTGGQHFFYSADGYSIHNSAGKLAPGIDIRGDGGYVVLPPSKTSAGEYQWHNADSGLLAIPPDVVRKLIPPPRAESPSSEDGPKGPSMGGDYWVRRACDRATIGTRHHTGVWLSIQLRAEGLTKEQASAYMEQYAKHCDHMGPCIQPAIDHMTDTLEWAYKLSDFTKKPATTSRVAPVLVNEDDPPEDEGNGFHDLPEGENIIPEIPVQDPLEWKDVTWADIAALCGSIQWDWQRWVARGFLHILAGESGQGKSTVATRLAACYVMGWDWPDGTAFNLEQGNVLWCESEGADALNAERANNWKLDKECLIAPLDEPMMAIDLDNKAHRNAIARKAKRDDIKLIVLDSLSAATVKRDENSSKMLEIVRWLANLAAHTGKPVFATHHLRKPGLLDGHGPSVHRLRGSSAIVQCARLVWSLDAPDAQNPEALRLSIIKSNLAKFPTPVGMKINDDGTVTFGQCPDTPHKTSAFEEARQFLLKQLKAGAMLKTVLDARIAEAGINDSSIKRAKTALYVESRKTSGGVWVYSLPRNNPEDEPAFPT